MEPGTDEVGDLPIDLLTELEHGMWRRETRGDPAWMDDHLTPDFTEFGRSGRSYMRDETIAMPVGEIAVELPLPDLRIRALADGVALVTYRTIEPRGHSHRTSVWRRDGDRWRMASHQGTPAPAAAPDGDSPADPDLPRVGLVTLVVHEYDPAIEFFVGVLGFELLADEPAVTTDGRPKRWVVVRPPGGGAGLLLARADGDDQRARVGDQTGGRVGFFLEVDDLAATRRRLLDAGVELVRPPTEARYGTVAVFRDIAGNLWDLIEPT